MRGSSSKFCQILGKWMTDCSKGAKYSSVKSDPGAVSIFGRSLVSSASAIVRTTTVQPRAVTGGLNNLGWMQLRSLRHMTFPPRHQPWGAWSSAGHRWLNLNDSTVIWALIAANGAVFMLWRIDPYFATKHFVVSLESLRSGRIWTALTASFSQQDFGHLASNMISLYFFGSDIGRIFGGRTVSFW